MSTLYITILTIENIVTLLAGLYFLVYFRAGQTWFMLEASASLRHFVLLMRQRDIFPFLTLHCLFVSHVINVHVSEP